MCFESPLDSKESQKAYILGYLDNFMTVIFVLEMLTKIIAEGFVTNGEKSYLKTSWNILDFLIVNVSLISIMFQHLNLSFLKAFLMLRILRPLRLI
jgi:hypothetical protein